VEEGLLPVGATLFAELSVVFMDTTSLSFEGRGGEELGPSRPLERLSPGSPSDDRRAGHGSGRAGRCAASCGPGKLPPMSPLCCRSSTGCALVLASGRICVVATGGMISAQSIAALEERKLEYVLGVRERSSGRSAQHRD